MIKTQHCPNCEATEQKLHDFRQEVSDAVWDYFRPYEVPSVFRHIIIWEPTPEPKPDPLVEVCNYIGFGHTDTEDMVNDLRAALNEFRLEIREKGQ
jgi:hypothetical protein